MANSVFIVFTRDWVDPKGNSNGPCVSGISGYLGWAKMSAEIKNAHPIAGASKWEVAEISSDLLEQNVVEASQ